MLHKDSIVQLTHDSRRGQAIVVRRGTAGRVLSTAVLRFFTSGDQVRQFLTDCGQAGRAAY